ncbi:GNAT family N-acetyltransferase [Chloroflexota bacterium]
MIIRKFNQEDAAQTATLIQKALIQVNSRDYSSKIIGHLVQAYTAERLVELAAEREIFVAVEDQMILGTASLAGDTIYTVFVHPDHHGRGIGTELMEAIESRASEKGIQTVSLPSSTTAYQFYQRLGYREVKRVQSDEHGMNIIMTKGLKDCG